MRCFSLFTLGLFLNSIFSYAEIVDDEDEASPLINAHDYACLDPGMMGMGNVMAGNCTNDEMQNWYFDDDTLVNKGTGMCLSYSNDYMEVTMMECDDDNEDMQGWEVHFPGQEDEPFHVYTKDDEMYLEYDPDNGTVGLAFAGTNKTQLWMFKQD